MNSLDLAWKIRKDAVEMAHISHSSHLGSILSIADIVAVLYTYFIDKEQLKLHDENRTRIVLSKGHAGMAIYAALAEIGLMSKDMLRYHYANGSRLSGHISHKGILGIEISTGSLGQGVCMAAGIALAGQKRHQQYRTFAIIGNGESNEGAIWEMALFSHQMKLNNFTVILDSNHMQGLGASEVILDMENIADKWKAFGWNVIEIDGHDHLALKYALGVIDEHRPTCIVANTIKGKGISFMENDNLWHYKDPQGQDYIRAIEELERSKP